MFFLHDCPFNAVFAFGFDKASFFYCHSKVPKHHISIFIDTYPLFMHLFKKGASFSTVLTAEIEAPFLNRVSGREPIPGLRNEKVRKLAKFLSLKSELTFHCGGPCLVPGREFC
jgi:hypothetical protein